MAAGALFTGIFGGGSDIYGSKPITPDLGASAAKAISANQTNLPGAEKLATSTNTFNQDEMMRMLRKAVPFYDQLQSKTRSIIDSQLSGQIPQDVQNAIERSGAARAIAGGYGGSGMHGNLVARDLGLTSLDLTQRGLDSASKWLSQTASMNMPQNQFNLSSMFISPEMQFNRDTLEAGIAAAPDPSARGAFDTEMGILGMAASVYSGGAGYTNYNKPNYFGGSNMMSMSGAGSGGYAGSNAGGMGGFTGALGGGAAGSGYGGF